MNISRNAPCHCGSGKKYKRCCASIKKYTLNTARINNKNQHDDNEQSVFEADEILDDEELIDSFDQLSEQDLFAAFDKVFGNMPEDELNKMMLSLHNRFRLDSLQDFDHIKQYQKVRNLHQEIFDEMVTFFDQGLFEHKIDSSQYKNYEDDYRTGKVELIGCEFDMESELGAKVFYDIMIYKFAPNMNCITEVFIEKNRYRKLEKIELLQSMMDSTTIGLFEIVEAEEETGYVTIENVLTGEEFQIIDIGLSGSPGADQSYMYTRIITHNGISFSTGLGMIFLKDNPFIRDFIEKEKQDYKPFGELLRLTTLYQYLDSAELEDIGVKVFMTEEYE